MNKKRETKLLETYLSMVGNAKVVLGIKNVIERTRRSRNVYCFLIQMFTLIVTCILAGYFFYTLGKSAAVVKVIYPEYRGRYQQYIIWR